MHLENKKYLVTKRSWEKMKRKRQSMSLLEKKQQQQKMKKSQYKPEYIEGNSNNIPKN